MNKNNYVLIWIFAAVLFSVQEMKAQVNFNSNIVIDSTLSSAVGRGNTSNGTCSFVGGDNSTASGLNSFAFGRQASSTGANSVAIGYCASSNGVISFAFGKHITSNQNSSMTIGFGQIDHPLVNNVSYSIAMGVGSNIPTFLITDSHFVGKTGKVAIGNTSEPQAKLHIRSDEGEEAGIILEPKQPETNSTFIRLHDENHGISVGTNGEMCINSGAENNQLPLTLNGKVGINAANDIEGFSLTVGGGIITDEVLIKDVGAWHDYVFGKNYGLMPLNELKAYISENQHLPDVPSEKEVMENGIELSEMQGILLKKIEELTLYTLKQQEIIESLQSRIEELERK